MAILLTTPHTYDHGHGDATVEYTHVVIRRQIVDTISKVLTLQMQYCNLGAGCVLSPEPVHTLQIRNTEAVVDQAGGVDPETGKYAVQPVEVVAAEPAFDNLRAAFVVAADDVDEEGYDVVANYLYGYLITNAYYNGSIV